MGRLTVENTPWLAEWVAELATNPPKVTGVLTRMTRDGEVLGECCLGVLCRVQDLDRSDRDGSRAYQEGATVSDQVPPQATTERLLGSRWQAWELDGLTFYSFDQYGYTDSLTTINDIYGFSHAQHADLIRYFGLRSHT